MAMDADELKGILKPDLDALYADSEEGNGISNAAFADRMAGIISKVIPYIQDKAEVPPDTTWMAGGDPVKGSPGKVQ
ncbi:MAG: hypothetical protein LBL20_02720 [Treponema sp.]|jgi:hypothetical protein|nr:hypothetical protein [Treponema sp.]